MPRLGCNSTAPALAALKTACTNGWMFLTTTTAAASAIPNGMAVLGLFRRLANSLFMEWRSHQNNPQYLTTTDFAVDMAAQGHRRALNMVTTIHPSFTRLLSHPGPSLRSH